MPSPFPGMDPYLEEPGGWPDVHHRLISLISDVLTAQLRPKYYCRIEERVFVDEEGGRHDRIPALRIEQRPGRGPFSAGSGSVAAVIEPITMTLRLADETHEARIEVISRADRQIVTVLEVLSPTNKRPGTVGHGSFQQKRQEIFHSLAHWIEIDLLRVGSRLELREELPPCHYVVHVSRSDDRPHVQTWPIQLPQRLPSIGVPLLPGDADTSLDLQQVLDNVYDRAAYDAQIDYRSDPVPPLAPEDAAWAHQWLQSRGLR